MDKPTAGVGATQKIEKQARQLAYDTRYKVKQMMKSTSGSRLDPASVTKAYLAQLAKSSAAPAVKARAKQMLTGNVKEEVMSSVDPKDMATDAIATALYKVFVEKKEDNVEEQVEELKEFYSRVNKKGERIYHVIVKDKKTGNTYTRDATREKIAELRANPNIASVEMSEVNKDAKKEKSKGANTAAVKAGKGLDPVGKEDGDIDNDGDEDKSDKYLMKRRNAVGAAIAKRKGVSEEFLGEVNTEKSNPDANGKKIDVMKGENKVVIAPELPGSGKQSSSFMQVAHYDMQGNPLSESEMKLAKMVQERTLTAPETKKKEEIVKSMKDKGEEFEKRYPGRGKEVMYATATKVAKRVAEETVAQADKKAKKEQDEMDPRSIPTAVNLAKNELRAMGLKCSYDPEGDQIDEVLGGQPGDGYLGHPRLGIKNPLAKKQTSSTTSSNTGIAGRLGNRASQMDAAMQQLRQSYEPEGEMVDEARAEEKRGLGSTGSERKRMKSGESGPGGRRPVTSYSGGQNPHLRGKGGTTKEQRRASTRRYVDQPGGTYGGPENRQGAGRYAQMQANRRDQSHMHSRYD